MPTKKTSDKKSTSKKSVAISSDSPSKTKKKNDLKKLITDINKHCGADVVSIASETANVFKVPYGLPALDYITNFIPVGRIIEHFGAFSSTKSLSAYKAISQFQKIDWLPGRWSLQENPKNTKTCALVDVEGTYTKSWGEKHGIDNDNLIHIMPQSLEQAVDITELLLGDPSNSLVVFDSMSAIGDKTEVENSMEKDQMSSTARFWNKSVRKLQNAINKNPEKCGTLMMINSAYEKVGFSMGNPEQIKNGNQLKLAKTISIRFNALKFESAENKETPLNYSGYSVSLTCLKNKLGVRGLKSSYFYNLQPTGTQKANTIDIPSQMIEVASTLGFIKRAGGWFSYQDLKIQGFDAFVDKILSSEYYEILEDEIYAEIPKIHSL